MNAPQDGAVLSEVTCHFSFFPIAPLHVAGTIPWPFEDRWLDVVLVPELWGSRCLLSRDRVGSVHFQSYTTQKSTLFHT